ncbi:TPA: hypothetical protein NGR52_004211 [Vibrio parahaemolyticus]|nr:hypothetical protein [Vibrio parahaemolyticus]
MAAFDAENIGVISFIRAKPLTAESVGVVSFIRAKTLTSENIGVVSFYDLRYAKVYALEAVTFLRETP